ncbi:MAG: redoxin family protein [Alphaproteobacteria bacterium]|nr:redoxin family protein [Alphaproteobacteria bacterium]
MIQKYLGIAAFFFIAMFLTHMLQVVRIDFTSPLTKTEVAFPDHRIPIYQKKETLTLPNRSHLLVFFSTKCKACEFEIISLNKIKKKYTNLPPMIGVAVYSNSDDLKTFFEKKENPFNEIAIDEKNEFSKLAKLTDLPTVFIVNQNKTGVFLTKGVLDQNFFVKNILSKITEISK